MHYFSIFSPLCFVWVTRPYSTILEGIIWRQHQISITFQRKSVSHYSLTWLPVRSDEQKWLILKSHTCKVFWWWLQPFLCRNRMVGGFWNFRGLSAFDIFLPSATLFLLLIGLSSTFMADLGRENKENPTYKI